jgi:hypothetical protein
MSALPRRFRTMVEGGRMIAFCDHPAIAVRDLEKAVAADPGALVEPGQAR